MRKKVITRSDKVIDAILSGLEEGRTLTSICTGDDMPDISATQQWCRKDADLDEKILRAWIRGLRIRHDMNADKQAAILDNPDKYDPKIINAMATVMRDINHTLMATLTRLDKRYSDKLQVENTGPMVISWEKTPEEVVAENLVPPLKAVN